MKVEITLCRKDLKDRTLQIDDINSSVVNLPYNKWREADRIIFIDDDGKCEILKESNL